MKTTKALFDTSCVYAVLKPSFEPTLAKQIPAQSKHCIYYSSQYLRMEFFRRWIITGIEIYMRAHVTNNIEETLQYFSHTFSSRTAKIVLQWAALFIKSIAANPPTEPIDQFGWEVFSLALQYDEIFRKHMVHPKAGCKRGEIDIDFQCSTLRKALSDFYERFTSEAFTCKLKSLLDIEHGCPRLRQLREVSVKGLPKEYRKGIKKLKDELETLIENHADTSCKECSKIGDIIIALEQPPKTILYHVDYSFSTICPLLKTEHKQLDSVYKTAPKISA